MVYGIYALCNHLRRSHSESGLTRWAHLKKKYTMLYHDNSEYFIKDKKLLQKNVNSYVSNFVAPRQIPLSSVNTRTEMTNQSSWSSPIPEYFHI